MLIQKFPSLTKSFIHMNSRYIFIQIANLLGFFQRCWWYYSTYELVDWVLWHINICGLFNAKSIFMQTVLFQTIQFSMSTQFNYQKHFYFNFIPSIRRKNRRNITKEKKNKTNSPNQTKSKPIHENISFWMRKVILNLNTVFFFLFFCFVLFFFHLYLIIVNWSFYLLIPKREKYLNTDRCSYID